MLSLNNSGSIQILTTYKISSNERIQSDKELQSRINIYFEKFPFDFIDMSHELEIK